MKYRIFKKINKEKGFVLLFAVTLSAILLAIALGVTNISFREIRFGTNARDTNDAFFAADTGIECAFFFDRSDQNQFPLLDSTTSTLDCAGSTVTVPSPSPANFWSFVISGLANFGRGCAKVTVDKTFSLDPDHIIVTSNGYNNGGGAGTCTPGSNAVERQIESRY